MSNSLDPGQDRCSVSPDLAANCLQQLSADDSETNVNQCMPLGEKNRSKFVKYLLRLYEGCPRKS